MLQLSQCRLPWQDASLQNLKKKTAQTVGISVDDLQNFEIIKRSIDARKKPEIAVSYTVRFCSRKEREVWYKNKKNRNLSQVKAEASLQEQIRLVKTSEKVVVVGAGPAG